VPRLQHVSLPIEEGGQERGRAFYGRLLGLAEKPVPSTRAREGFVWFDAGPGELELHLVPDPLGLVAHARRHVCLEVENLAGIRRRLAEAGVATEDAPTIHNRPRFYCTDPFGNRLEIVTILGSYS
jgi:catechol 2,3-dioxygenase-like lactoylglutathione lyase family enzyme